MEALSVGESRDGDGANAILTAKAYLDVTDYLRGGMTAWATAKDIRKRIHDETALTASAGISYNKFLAKQHRFGP
jgi:nucleotidyltransferase/DNA polymerase involved in DNA repair